MSAEPRIDGKELRRVLGAFVTGVTVVTTTDAEGRRWGLTANSFSSVSLDPPLVLWSQSIRAPSHAAFAAAGRFAVNILAEDQIELSNRFARRGSTSSTGSTSTPARAGCRCCAAAVPGWSASWCRRCRAAIT
jgi:flavin reductase (DIM6/NTAB) family NADH-FMN oxidoreductase RutF